MGKKYVIDEVTLIAMADAIRTKTAGTGLIATENMDDAILSIENGIDTSDATATASEIFFNETAYVNGKKVTGEFTIDSELTEQDEIITQIETALTNKTNSYDNGYADGVQAEYDHFWDTYQDYGNKTNYFYVFSGATWTKEIFKPKYSIKPTSESEGMFLNADINVDLVEHLGNLGVTLDLSKATSLSKAFQKTEFTRLGLIDTTNITSCANIFANSDLLKTIDVLKCKYTNTWSSAFTGCSALENLTIDGKIGKAVSFADCKKLSHDSLMSIINHLRELSSTLTLTLGSTNLAKLTDAEKAIATEKGWTLA